ncbi:F-box/FBD/LRR-repeat protein [Cardamine amara subsp. amara]|uniref:F-box/FBD/LRR-repeat protein n=1 Tax=Cardamine amara subsp. amara TaxID=228776 RepID=A0ABD0ZM22_CARAN
MFSFNNTLETLKLKHSVLLHLPDRVFMKSLRTLHLDCVDFKDNQSIRFLISGCPNLENLVIDRGYPNVVHTFVIVAPSLKTLSIKDYGGLEDGGYVINAPSLKYLKIEEFSHCGGCCLIENVPMLVEANIKNVSYIVNETILGSLKSAKRLVLDLSPLEITYPTGTIFYQLVNLEMYTRKAEWWNLLALMLDNSPKLQVLKLIGESEPLDLNKDVVVGGKWNQPKNVPECLLSHLKIFVWTGYDWEREEEKEVATYILKNASQLKNANFFTKPIIQSKELNKLEETSEMLKELDGVVRASSSCHLVFVG